MQLIVRINMIFVVKLDFIVVYRCCWCSVVGNIILRGGVRNEAI